MLVNHPLTDYDFIKEEEHRAFTRLGYEDALTLLVHTFTPQHRDAVARASSIATERLDAILSVCELTSVPDVTEAEARMLTYLGFDSLRRLRETDMYEILAAQEDAHKATLSRLKLVPLEEERIDEILFEARYRPHFIHMPWDAHRQAGRRWLSDPALTLAVLPIIWREKRDVLAGIAGEIRQEVNRALLKRLATETQGARDQPSLAHLAHSSVVIGVAAAVPSRTSLREDVEAQYAELTDRLGDHVSEADLSNGLLEGVAQHVAREADRVETLLADTRALTSRLRDALLEEQPTSLERLVYEFGARLEALLLRLERGAIFPSVWDVRGRLSADADFSEYGRAYYRWFALRLEIRLLLHALAVLQLQWFRIATEPRSTHARSWRQMARRAAPYDASPLREHTVDTVFDDPPPTGARIVVTGELLPVQRHDEWEYRLYGTTAEHVLTLKNVADVLSTAKFLPFETTPVTVAGAVAVEAHTLHVAHIPDNTESWEMALVLAAGRQVPLFEAERLLAAPLTLTTAGYLLTLPQQEQEENND